MQLHLKGDLETNGARSSFRIFVPVDAPATHEFIKMDSHFPSGKDNASKALSPYFVRVWIPCFIEIWRYCFIQSRFVNYIRSHFLFFHSKKQLRECFSRQVLIGWKQYQPISTKQWIRTHSIDTLLLELEYPKGTFDNDPCCGILATFARNHEKPMFGNRSHCMRGFPKTHKNPRKERNAWSDLLPSLANSRNLHIHRMVHEQRL